MKFRDHVRIKPGALISSNVIEQFPNIREATLIVIFVLQDDVLASILHPSNPSLVIFRFTKDQLEKVEQ